MREKSKLFFINGSILTATALLMKFASLVFSIYVTNKIGSEAVGIFTLIMTVYLFFITIATSGLNVAVSVLVSEYFAKDKGKLAIKTIRTCILCSLLLGLFASFLIIIFSNFIINVCLHNRVSSKILFYIGAGLPFIAMSACINSYFTSIRKAYKNAITQVFEFVVKVIATIYLLKMNISKGVENICISLILADVISEVCSFTLVYILYKLDIRSKKYNNIHSFGQRLNILKISFPVAVTSYIRSGLSALKQLIIPSQLEKSGLSCEHSLSAYGMINGMILPVITFPTVLIYSYCQLIIPEISTYCAQNNFKAINYVSNKAFKILCSFAFCIAFIFWKFSNELGMAIYNNVEAGLYFKILAPLTFFMYVDHIVDCILKGLNKQFGVMCCNIIDLCFTTCFIYFLLPIYGINGYLFSFVFSEILNFSISFWQMIKYSRIRINVLEWFIFPFAIGTLTIFISNIFHFSFSNMVVNLIMNILLFVTTYFLLAFFTLKKNILLFNK